MIEALHIENLALSRGGRTLFSGLNLTLSPGEACAVTGANGVGKTSLLRAVAGLLAPTQGAVRFASCDSGQARAEDLHLLGHQDGLKPARTAREEFEFWASWYGSTLDAQALALNTLQLDGLMPLEVRKLSAGQRRRLALSRLIACPRTLWLLDEPASPLDRDWRARLGGMITAHLAAGGMVLAAVHDPLPGGTRTLEIGG